MKNLNFLPGLFLLLAPLFLKAEISTPKIFSDNMVLQRGTPVNIWGKSEKNADVEIEFLGEKTAAKAAVFCYNDIHFPPLRLFPFSADFK